LYLPRLFVYHVENNSAESSKIFKVMEKRLMKIIMNPAMIVTWASGLSVLWILGFNSIFSLWLSIKFLLVIALSGYHGFLSKCLKDFEFDRNIRSSKFFRVINEIPTIILIIIVFLAIFKPA
jgi:putative membrane protein